MVFTGILLPYYRFNPLKDFNPMTKFSMILFLLLSQLTLSGQNFEGRIIYSNKYMSKLPEPNSEQLTSIMGKRQEYIIKGNNYKSLTDGMVAKWQMYRAKENKMYYSMAGKDAILWTDAGMNEDVILQSEIHKNAITILGYSCDELVLTCKSGVQKYYYNTKLKIDPATFAEHKFGNWSEILNRTKALPLKMIVDNSMFTIESTATEVIPSKIEDSVFELPEGVALQEAKE